jgi:hypothetical protein
MRFEPNPQKYRLDARRRIITLLIFAVVVVGIFVTLTQTTKVFNEAGLDLIELPQDDPDMVIRPGEARVNIPRPEPVEGADDGDSAFVLGGDLDEVPPNQEPKPFRESPEILQEASTADFTSTVPPKPLAYLFQKVRTNEHWTNDGQLTSPEEQDRLWKILEQDSSSARGTEFVLEGVLISSDRSRDPLEIFGLPIDNPSGLNRYYRSYLFTGRKLFLVATCEQPERPFEDRDRVRVRASFLHVYANEIEKEGRFESRAIPFLVGRSFTPVSIEAGTGFHVAVLPYIVIGLIGSFAIALIVIQVILSRGDGRYDSRVRRLRSSLARHGVQARDLPQRPSVDGTSVRGEDDS